MGNEESTLNCACARTRGGAGSNSSRYDTSDKPASDVKGFEAVESVTISDVAKDGYLDKTSNSKHRKPRYFRLKSDLYYFTTKENPTPKGVVLLQPHERLPVVSECSSLGTHCFQIIYPTVCFLKAETEAESQAWANAITSTITGSESQPNGNAPNSGGERGAVLYEGYLIKKSFAPEWKRYWFVLRPGVLEYYTNIQDTHPKGAISLSKEYMTPKASVCRYQQSILRVQHPKTLYAMAESRDDQEEWIAMIQSSIDQTAADKHALKKNPIGWKRQGKLREVITPLLDLLRDPYRLEYFRRFMREFSSEPYLYFWLDVQQFKRLCRKEEKMYLRPCAATIYSKYIKEGGEYELDLPKSVREETAITLDDPTVHTFRDAQLFVYEILHDDFYAQFLTSNSCAAMAHALFTL